MSSQCDLFCIEKWLCIQTHFFTKLYGALWRQREYTLDKPARDAAAKLKAEADAEEASRAAEIPLHDENEWNIR